MTEKQTMESIGREWLQARDIIAAVFLEVAPSYGMERCEHFAACTLARLAHAGILTIRAEDYPETTGSIRENLAAIRAASREYDPGVFVGEFEAVVAAERRWNQ